MPSPFRSPRDTRGFGPPRRLRVHTVFYDGVEEQDFAGHVEVFGIVGADRVAQSFVTADGPRRVTTSAGMDIVCRDAWSPRTADVIIVPGGGYGAGSALQREIQRRVLPRALAAARRDGLVLGAVCSGTMLLSAAGLTARRRCTTHHIAQEELRAQGAHVVGGRVVDDGDLVTCGGVTSGIDLGLWLLERFFARTPRSSPRRSWSTNAAASSTARDHRDAPRGGTAHPPPHRRTRRPPTACPDPPTSTHHLRKESPVNRRTLLRSATALGATGLAAGMPVDAAGAAPTATSRTRDPLRVHVVLFPGVEELDFAAPYEVLSVSDEFTDRDVDVRHVTVDGARTVTAAFGTTLRVDHGWAPEQADLLVVPGGGYARRKGPGVWAEIRRGVLPRALAEARRPGLTLSALCTGVMLLSAAGLTRGRPCTTHHKARADLERQGGRLKNARVVDDGDLVTAGGVTSGLDLALWLVRRELGTDTALGVENLLEYEARGTVWTSGKARPGRPAGSSDRP